MKKNTGFITKSLIALIMGCSLAGIAGMSDANASSNAWDFGYTGSVQQFTAPYTGTYKLEVWGAQGGYSYQASGSGGSGGYSSGEVNLSAGQTIYVYVGGKGQDSSNNWNDYSATAWGGWNGGGTAYVSGAGGGADLLHFRRWETASTGRLE